ncbi:MAG: cytochrome b [Gammaproteobacteria bacterium]|nr:cytochrome b [Gammaproteobacteria bacterium]
MLKNSNNNFGLVSKTVHWLSAVMLLSLFAVGFWMVDLSYYSEWYRVAPYYHKAFGLTLLALTIFRLVWKLATPQPEIIANNKAEKTIAKLGHAALYLFMFVIMISGYLISTADGRGIELFNIFTVPSLGEFIENQEDVAGVIHEYAAYTIMFLIVGHIAAALKHHFIDKDDTLKRMTH